MKRWNQRSLLVFLLIKCISHVSSYHACAFITFLKIVATKCFNILHVLIVLSVSFLSLFYWLFFSSLFSGFFACPASFLGWMPNTVNFYVIGCWIFLVSWALFWDAVTSRGNSLIFLRLLLCFPGWKQNSFKAKANFSVMLNIQPDSWCITCFFPPWLIGIPVIPCPVWALGIVNPAPFPWLISSPFPRYCFPQMY